LIIFRASKGVKGIGGGLATKANVLRPLAGAGLLLAADVAAGRAPRPGAIAAFYRGRTCGARRLQEALRDRSEPGLEKAP
jgi:hypothetical protein